MKNLTVLELEPIQNLVNEATLLKLEYFFINTNLNRDERIKLVNILTDALKNQKEI